MKVCAMVDRSAGNESVGNMWTETAVFDDDTPLLKVLEWAEAVRYGYLTHELYCNYQVNVRLAILQEPTGDKEPKREDA